MNYRGQLMIAISAQNQHILVEVRDHGCAFQQRLKTEFAIFHHQPVVKAVDWDSVSLVKLWTNTTARSRWKVNQDTVFRVRLPYNFSRSENSL